MPFCHLSRKKAFSLIEAAIVLGVVGLVIGGIWVGAGMVTANRKLNDTQAGILAIAQQLRQLYQNMQITTTADATPLLAAGALPPGFAYNSTSGLITDPYGNAIDIRVVLCCFRHAQYSYFYAYGT